LSNYAEGADFSEQMSQVATTTLRKACSVSYAVESSSR
jgi:hypothetical protein